MIRRVGVFALAACLLTAAASAKDDGERAPVRQSELGLFSQTDFNGRNYIIKKGKPSVDLDFNIRSIGVHPGDKWQICADTRYREPCIILDRSVADARDIGVEGAIGSARPAEE
ncbi:MAG: hypothetical protein ACFBQW_01035 [Sphingomonadaceae bacterium]